MTDFATIQRKWAESAIGADRNTLDLAQWLYEVAIDNKFCEKCDPTIIPPLYIALAERMLFVDDTILNRLIVGSSHD